MTLTDLKVELLARAPNAAGEGCFPCRWILEDLDAHGQLTDAEDQHSDGGKPMFPKKSKLAHLKLEKIDVPSSEAILPPEPTERRTFHTCHWPSCGREVPPKLWGCRAHWYLLPKWIRNEIWKAYIPGQEERKDPSSEYVKIARIAHDWVLEYETKQRMAGGDA